MTRKAVVPTIAAARSDRHAIASIPRGALELVEPIKAHFLDHAVADDDQPRGAVVGGEVLVNGERRNVDEIAARPSEALGLARPIPLEGVEAVEFQIPVQVVAKTFDDEQNLFPHVPVLARALTGFQRSE